MLLLSCCLGFFKSFLENQNFLHLFFSREVLCPELCARLGHGAGTGDRDGTESRILCGAGEYLIWGYFGIAAFKKGRREP